MSEFIINDERVYYKRNYKEINDKKIKRQQSDLGRHERIPG